MRELKFRAWDKLDKEFAHNIDCLLDISVAERVFALDDEGGELIIEQYTGIKDKNDKPIYEGDIVRCYSRKKLLGDYQVIWNEDCGGFECESLKPLIDGGGRMLKDIRVFNEISIQFRVIGNIHENSDLMEGK